MEQQRDTVRIRGRNVLEEEEKRSVAGDFIRQLNDPLIYILLAAAAISLFLGELGDMCIIVSVIALNGAMGVIQEGKARKALKALKQMTSPTAWIRDGSSIREIPAADLIPGDVVCLEAGMQVPADLELIRAVQLSIEESALTGESVPVSKNTSDCRKAYMSTNVTGGRGEGVVTAIGMDTEIGKIAGLIRQSLNLMTPLQHRLADLGSLLGVISVLLCVLLFVLSVVQKRDVPEMLLTAISLAVAAVPEGLPAIVTMVLALSVSRMAKVRTIVKRLPSVETLGCVSVVCTDKTGTLTQNRMTVMKCWLDGEVRVPSALRDGTASDFLYGFALCNDASAEGKNRRGDPTELALLDMAALNGVTAGELEKRLPREGELAFDSSRKRMTTFHRGEGRRVSYTKGSPEEILSRCTAISVEGAAIKLDDAWRKRLDQVLSRFAGDSLRVLALAKKEPASGPEEDGLTLLGMAGIADPVRPEAKQAIADFRRAGVDTVMITGDRRDTALAVARELELADSPEQCMTGEELEGLADQRLLERLPKIRVFAHVAPEHKVRIVEGYQALGKVVAMTGDGVNDAPSLKRADVGIAMGRGGTDVARQAADLVLTDDNFATIANAIAQGRCIYENIRKAVVFLLSSNFGEILTMLLAVAFGLAAPLKSSHILWINLITDSLPALALGVDRQKESLFMNRPPRAKTESLFAGGGLCGTVFYGLLIAAVSTAAFLYLPVCRLLAGKERVTLAGLDLVLQDFGLLARSQTYAFTVLGMSQLFHAVGMRNVELSVIRMNHLENKLMIAAFALGLSLQLLVTEIPVLVSVFGTASLSLTEWLRLLLLSAAPLGAHECLILLSDRQIRKEKRKRARKYRKNNQKFKNS